MWKFTAADGWSKIEDFLPDDLTDESIIGLGFTPGPLRYGEEEGFEVVVWTGGRADLAYGHLVEVNIGSIGEFIAVPTLPDLLALMQQLLPMTSGAR